MTARSTAWAALPLSKPIEAAVSKQVMPSARSPFSRAQSSPPTYQFARSSGESR